MKKFMLIFLFPVMLWGQDEVPKKNLRFHHIGLMFGGAFVHDVEFGDDTVNMELEVAASLSKHIFKGSLMIGTLSNSFNGVGDYNEYNLLYGREFELNPYIFFDAYAGAGYFAFMNYDPDAEDFNRLEQTIGFPLEASFRFPVWNWFSIAAKVHHNINSIAPATAIGLQLQFRFE